MSLTDILGNSYPVTYNIVTEANGGSGNTNGLGGKTPYDFNNFPGDTSNLLSNYKVVGVEQHMTIFQIQEHLA
jgi:hypothetical protein